MADPGIVVARLGCLPVVREDRRGERLSGFPQLSLSMQGHGEDETGNGSVEMRCTAAHRGDGLVKLLVTVFRQSPGKQKPRNSRGVNRWVGRRGPPGQGDGLAQ